MNSFQFPKSFEPPCIAGLFCPRQQMPDSYDSVFNIISLTEICTYLRILIKDTQHFKASWRGKKPSAWRDMNPQPLDWRASTTVLLLSWKHCPQFPKSCFFLYQLQSPKAITETIEDVWSFDLETGKSVFLFQVDPWEPTPKLISDEHSRAASLHLPLNRQKSLSRILSKQIIWNLVSSPFFSPLSHALNPIQS